MHEDGRTKVVFRLTQLYSYDPVWPERRDLLQGLCGVPPPSPTSYTYSTYVRIELFKACKANRSPSFLFCHRLSTAPCLHVGSLDEPHRLALAALPADLHISSSKSPKISTMVFPPRPGGGRLSTLVEQYVCMSRVLLMYEHLYRAGVPSLVHRALQIPRPSSTTRVRSDATLSVRTTTSHATPSASARNIAGGAASSIVFSANQPTDLPDRVSKLTAWAVSPSNMGITRQFTFPSFSAAWHFMSRVADKCKTKKHHPSWHNLYNQVTIEWTTHKPQGLSINDVEMAEFCDRTADEIGLKTDTCSSATTSSQSWHGRGDHIVTQKRAMHIPSEAIALKLRRRFRHRR
ncbi:hypothetical protein CC78DRAFT_318308 [Lojkania enalia]|uniref:4a-hydroxytetrahydrobiopterin dehydratase n=1 Tax=Lojkania enalia TaxID=147567 RepID=A0A9P4K6E9_9PLEO|nr:hypothetical protein CC78DRAFT_318308 [Didymosphaeria enalia]